MREERGTQDTAGPAGEAGTERCEVLVVGHGEAGPSLAANLRAAGLDVLLTTEETTVETCAQGPREVVATLSDAAQRVRVRCSYLVDDREGVWRDGRRFGIGGLDDARNLAWKLAAVVRGAGADLLDSYHPERSGRRPKDYRKSVLSQELGGKRLKLRAGDRVPDVRLWDPGNGSDVRLGELLTGLRWVVLGLGSKTAETVTEIAQRYPAAVRTEVVGGGSVLVTGVTLQDRYGQARRAIARRGGTVLVIRPDGYLGLRSGPTPDIIAAYLEDLVPDHPE